MTSTCARQGFSDDSMMPSLCSLATSSFINCASSTLNLQDRVAMGLTSGDRNWNERGASTSAAATPPTLVDGTVKESNLPTILNVIERCSFIKSCPRIVSAQMSLIIPRCKDYEWLITFTVVWTEPHALAEDFDEAKEIWLGSLLGFKPIWWTKPSWMKLSEAPVSSKALADLSCTAMEYPPKTVCNFPV